MNEFGIKELFEEDLEKSEIGEIRCKAGYDPITKRYYLILPFWLPYKVAETAFNFGWENKTIYSTKNGVTIAIILTKVRK